jgi:ParB family chromosome partitioning protein
MAQAMVSANEIRQADTPLGRAKKMADALERGHDEDDLALMFGVSVQTVRATLSLLDATRLFAMQWSLEQSPLPRRVSWHRLNPKSSGKVSEIEAATAGTTGHEKARRQRQILGDAKPRLKTRKEITKALESRVSMRAHCAGCLGRRYEY